MKKTNLLINKSSRRSCGDRLDYFFPISRRIEHDSRIRARSVRIFFFFRAPIYRSRLRLSRVRIIFLHLPQHANRRFPRRSSCRMPIDRFRLIFDSKIYLTLACANKITRRGPEGMVSRYRDALGKIGEFVNKNANEKNW